MQEPTLAKEKICPHAERIVAPWVTIQRTRLLPHPGQILRRRGDRVAADTVIGETDLPGGYLLVELDRELGPRVRDAHQVMQKRVGASVQKNDVLARTRGILRREYLCPVDGKIADMSDSRVLIEIAPQHVEVVALYPGEIVSVMPRAGVEIETSGALIQGDWGTGSSFRSTLHCPVPTGDVPLLAGQITADHTGCILIGGRGLDAAALDQAIETRVRGIVVGSISSELLPQVQESELSFIVIEGLGDVAMPADTFALLHKCVGKEVCFSPTPEGTAQAHKPEIFYFGSLEDREDRPAPLVQSLPFAKGTRVRALREPYLYAEGEIISIPEGPQRLASGVYAWGAVVDLESSGRVFVPLTNLESIRGN
jgi:hypothetical protein